MIRRTPICCLVFGLALSVAGCATREPVPGPRVPQAGAPQPPQAEPRAYQGMTAAALRQTLGAPAFVRKDGGAQMWRYDGAACRAFFFLYDGKTGQAVRHVETLPRGTVSAADPGCLAALRLSPAKTS